MNLFKKYLKPFYAAMVLGLIIKVVGTVMDLFIPRILQYLIDEIAPRQDKNLVLIWGGIMIVCSVVAILANIIANRMAAAVARDFIIAVRKDLFAKTVRLSSKESDHITLPTLETRLTGDTYNIHQLVGMMQRIGVRAPILLIGGIISTALMEPFLTLVLVGTLPFIVIIFMTVSKKGVKLFTKQQVAVDSLVRTVRENIRGIRVIKALSKGNYECEKFEKVNKDVFERETAASYTTAKTNPLMSLCLNLGLTAVVLVGAFRVASGQSTPAKIMVLLTYFTIILNAMMIINRLFIMYTKGLASANRITDILELEDESDLNVSHEVKNESKKNDAVIQFKNVSFSYGDNKTCLSNVSFSVSRGSSLGIIGATGSGKTTIARLMTRFFDADSGEVLYDGENVKKLDIYELRKKFGFVQQNDMIILGTVSENIKFGREIPDEAVVSAAKTAQAVSFINDMDDGFDTMLTAKGTNLSGGQKQRIFIARAICGDPEVLILDDSSSALDYRTDYLLRKAISEDRKGKTLVMIAQRISSVKNCDDIIVVDKGRIIAEGKHDELLEKCDIYKAISASQMGGEIADG